jgi:hypothetical protein
MSVLVCLRSSCMSRDGDRKIVMFVRLALNVVTQNDGGFVDVILLYVFPVCKAASFR